MKRMIGFILIWLAVGMLIKLFITNTILTLLLIAVLFFIGYRLFLC